MYPLISESIHASVLDKHSPGVLGGTFTLKVVVRAQYNLDCPPQTLGSQWNCYIVEVVKIPSMTPLGWMVCHPSPLSAREGCAVSLSLFGQDFVSKLCPWSLQFQLEIAVICHVTISSSLANFHLFLGLYFWTHPLHTVLCKSSAFFRDSEVYPLMRHVVSHPGLWNTVMLPDRSIYTLSMVWFCSHKVLHQVILLSPYDFSLDLCHVMCTVADSVSPTMWFMLVLILQSLVIVAWLSDYSLL
jgi:hypothetical protein